MTNSVESRGVTHLESMNLSNALSSLWVGHRPMSNSRSSQWRTGIHLARGARNSSRPVKIAQYSVLLPPMMMVRGY
jgi:hypothetical protein